MADVASYGPYNTVIGINRPNYTSRKADGYILFKERFSEISFTTVLDKPMLAYRISTTKCHIDGY